MSLYDRLNLTRPNHRPLKVPIWERIDLTRPPKLRCQGCRSRIQSHWEFCPSCGRTLIEKNSEFRRCIWVDVSGMDIEEEHREAINNILVDAFSKVYGAFRSVEVFLTSDPPEAKEWGNNFTHVYIFADNQPVDYLGVASFKLGMVTDRAIIRIDRVFYASYNASLNVNQLSNLIANTIVHEIGHTLGLDHSALPTDVMHDGLDHIIHSSMPPSFHASQINSMNNAIRRHAALKVD
ncbi:MAG: matrixin family metalloprotease [Nostoc sp. EkiNYC01]|nr:matrixin family metalloprotease [Nostoc sp. EkiNYC01]